MIKNEQQTLPQHCSKVLLLLCLQLFTCADSDISFQIVFVAETTQSNLQCAFESCSPGIQKWVLPLLPSQTVSLNHWWSSSCHPIQLQCYLCLFSLLRNDEPALVSLPKPRWCQLAADGALTCSPRRWPMQKHVAVSEQLQCCSWMRGSSLGPLCALEILTLVCVSPAPPSTLWPLQFHAATSSATLSAAAPLAGMLFDLLASFQIISLKSLLLWSYLMLISILLILVPLYLIYIKYRICLFLWMGNVFAHKLLCIVKVLGKK